MSQVISLSPAFQRFFLLLKNKYGARIPQNIKNEYRKGRLPLIKDTHIRAFNTGVIVLFISLIIKMPWIYFVFELTVLNGILIYMIVKHEKLSNRLYLSLFKENQ